MHEAVDYARALFHKGLPLMPTLDRRLALDIELFSEGGLAILSKIEQQEYRVLDLRPKISKSERVWLLLRTILHWSKNRIFSSQSLPLPSSYDAPQPPRIQ